ncbi:unnamed protein product [Ectocarpus sp. 8 AP-2014]
MRLGPTGLGDCSQEGDQQANGVEQRWQEAAAALGPAERQVKFLRLLGAKKGAAATAAAAGASTASRGMGNPFSPSPGAGGAGADDGQAANAKVMQDLEIHYQKAHRAHFGFQRGLGK